MEADFFSKNDIAAYLGLFNICKNNLATPPLIYRMLLAILEDYDPTQLASKERTERYIKLLVADKDLANCILMCLPDRITEKLSGSLKMVQQMPIPVKKRIKHRLHMRAVKARKYSQVLQHHRNVSPKRPQFNIVQGKHDRMVDLYIKKEKQTTPIVAVTSDGMSDSKESVTTETSHNSKTTVTSPIAEMTKASLAKLLTGPYQYSVPYPPAVSEYPIAFTNNPLLPWTPFQYMYGVNACQPFASYMGYQRCSAPRGNDETLDLSMSRVAMDKTQQRSGQHLLHSNAETAKPVKRSTSSICMKQADESGSQRPKIASLSSENDFNKAKASQIFGQHSSISSTNDLDSTRPPIMTIGRSTSDVYVSPCVQMQDALHRSDSLTALQELTSQIDQDEHNIGNTDVSNQLPDRMVRCARESFSDSCIDSSAMLLGALSTNSSGGVHYGIIKTVTPDTSQLDGRAMLFSNQDCKQISQTVHSECESILRTDTDPSTTVRSELNYKRSFPYSLQIRLSNGNLSSVDIPTSQPQWQHQPQLAPCDADSKVDMLCYKTQSLLNVRSSSASTSALTSLMKSATHYSQRPELHTQFVGEGEVGEVDNPVASNGNSQGYIKHHEDSNDKANVKANQDHKMITFFSSKDIQNFASNLELVNKSQDIAVPEASALIGQPKVSNIAPEVKVNSKYVGKPYERRTIIMSSRTLETLNKNKSMQTFPVETTETNPEALNKTVTITGKSLIHMIKEKITKTRALSDSSVSSINSVGDPTQAVTPYLLISAQQAPKLSFLLGQNAESGVQNKASPMPSASCSNKDFRFTERAKRSASDSFLHCPRSSSSHAAPYILGMSVNPSVVDHELSDEEVVQ